MIIRSQNKRIITTDLNLYIEPRDNNAIGNVTCWIKNKTMGILGTYYSWKKATKVLDMIQDKYSEYVAIANGWDNIHSINVVPKVFQMPLDEEVEV